MNTSQIQCIIKCDNQMSKTIIGVYARDQTPK